jgi:folate-dependent phosphoribosylglycinamide formyltransferase PurN
MMAGSSFLPEAKTFICLYSHAYVSPCEPFCPTPRPSGPVATSPTRLAESFRIPFYCLPVTPETKPAQEKQILELCARHHGDLVVLARYMQVLTEGFLEAAPPVINIHHGFLPAFQGAKPYHQAHSRGVKLVGATAHYATKDLDQGPIIEQDVARVTHAMGPDEMVRVGRDVERVVLSRGAGAPGAAGDRRGEANHRVVARTAPTPISGGRRPRRLRRHCTPVLPLPSRVRAPGDGHGARPQAKSFQNGESSLPFLLL